MRIGQAEIGAGRDDGEYDIALWAGICCGRWVPRGMGDVEDICILCHSAFVEDDSFLDAQDGFWVPGMRSCPSKGKFTR